MARSESLKKAQKKYAAKHKSSMNRNTYKSAGKNFILNYATKEDLKEYERFILRYIVKKYCILYKTCMLKVKTEATSNKTSRSYPKIGHRSGFYY